MVIGNKDFDTNRGPGIEVARQAFSEIPLSNRAEALQQARATRLSLIQTVWEGEQHHMPTELIEQHRLEPTILGFTRFRDLVFTEASKANPASVTNNELWKARFLYCLANPVLGKRPGNFTGYYRERHFEFYIAGHSSLLPPNENDIGVHTIDCVRPGISSAIQSGTLGYMGTGALCMTLNRIVEHTEQTLAFIFQIEDLREAGYRILRVQESLDDIHLQEIRTAVPVPWSLAIAVTPTSSIPDHANASQFGVARATSHYGEDWIKTLERL